MNSKPKCVIVAGPPGSGKTTLAKKLGERLHMPVISRDEIKEGYVNTLGIEHGLLPPDTNARVTMMYFELVNRYLAGKISVVIEAAFQHQIWESGMRLIAELASPVIVLCSLDAAAAAQRHLQRGLDDPKREFYHGDKRVAHFKETGETLPPSSYSPPKFNVPTIEVSTVDGYVPGLEEIVRLI